MSTRIAISVLSGIAAGCAVGALFAALAQFSIRHMQADYPQWYASYVAFLRTAMLVVGGGLGGITGGTYSLVRPTRSLVRVLISVTGCVVIAGFISQWPLPFGGKFLQPVASLVAAIIGGCIGAFFCVGKLPNQGVVADPPLGESPSRRNP